VSGRGWIPDLPDRRDVFFAAPARPVPAAVDLRDRLPPAYDQGDLESCTANAIAAALEFNQAHQGLTNRFRPSRLFIWYYERWLEDKVESNAGVMLRNGMKVVNKSGAPPESVWPYDRARFREEPSAEASEAAARHQAIRYQRLPQRLRELKGCLASGFPFVFGFTEYESFTGREVRRTGEVPMPELDERAITGHAVLAVGYSDATRRFSVRNSWGASWGDEGYFTMPYEYVLDRDLARDLWTIREVEPG
jgi:C1A family cysteine protease